MKRNQIACLAIAAIVVALSAAMLSGCWSRSTTPSGPAGATPPARQSRPTDPAPAPNSAPLPATSLRLFGAEPDTLDPALAQDVTSWTYMLQIFSGLVGLDNDLKVVPDLAKDWRVDASGTVYTFPLRSGVKFQDGRVLTASDVKFSLERAADPKLRAPMASVYLGDIVGVADKLAGRAQAISGVRVVDDGTIEITIDAPKPYFLAKLTYPTAFAVDRKNVEQPGEWWRNPNGTGPFKLREWESYNQIVLEANRNYYGGQPQIAEVSFYLGPGSPVVMYERGEIDVAPVGSGDVDRVTDPANPLNKELVVTPQLDIFYLGFSVKTKPFDDVKVRQAFQLATDRQRIVEVLMRNMRVKADGVLPPDLPGFDRQTRQPDFDPEKAKDLLAQSSYGGPDRLPRITLTVGSEGAGFGESLAEMYAGTLGVQIDVEEAQGDFFDDLNAHKFQMFYLGWVADYPDPQDFLDILFHSRSEGNRTGYANPQVDRLLEQARTEPDQQKRWALYQQAERIVVGEAPIVPLFHNVDYVLIKPTVQGLTWTPVGVLSFRAVTVQPQRKPGTL